MFLRLVMGPKGIEGLAQKRRGSQCLTHTTPEEKNLSSVCLLPEWSDFMSSVPQRNAAIAHAPPVKFVMVASFGDVFVFERETENNCGFAEVLDFV